MKVILTENIDRLGKMGEIVTVKEGYARNFLIPNKKARPANDSNMKLLNGLKKKQAVEGAKTLASAKSLADKLSALSITIPAKVGEEEKLYGSVTTEMIADALKAEGVEIDKKDIILEEQIKKLGIFQASVKVHPEVKANLRIWVVKE